MVRAQEYKHNVPANSNHSVLISILPDGLLYRSNNPDLIDRLIELSIDQDEWVNMEKLEAE
jgi:hypothetical protein